MRMGEIETEGRMPLDMNLEASLCILTQMLLFTQRDDLANQLIDAYLLKVPLQLIHKKYLLMLLTYFPRLESHTRIVELIVHSSWEDPEILLAIVDAVTILDFEEADVRLLRQKLYFGKRSGKKWLSKFLQARIRHIRMHVPDYAPETELLFDKILMVVHLHENDYKQTMQRYNRRYMQNPKMDFWLGEFLNKQGDTAAAITSFHQAWKEHGDEEAVSRLI